MSWFVQRVKLSGQAQARNAAQAINGGGSMGGIDFPASTKAVALRDELVIAMDDRATAVLVRRKARRRDGLEYCQGTTHDGTLGSLPVEAIGVSTLSDLLVIANALAEV